MSSFQMKYEQEECKPFFEAWIAKGAESWSVETFIRFVNVMVDDGEYEKVNTDKEELIGLYGDTRIYMERMVEIMDCPSLQGEDDVEIDMHIHKYDMRVRMPTTSVVKGEKMKELIEVFTALVDAEMAINRALTVLFEHNRDKEFPRYPEFFTKDRVVSFKSHW